MDIKHKIEYIKALTGVLNCKIITVKDSDIKIRSLKKIEWLIDSINEKEEPVMYKDSDFESKRGY